MQQRLSSAIPLFQSTPSVWREICGYQVFSGGVYISIHSLRVEGDLPFEYATVQLDISIHSLRVEGDSYDLQRSLTRLYFNPLPPCGGRLIRRHAPRYCVAFQSTPSVWRETAARGGSGLKEVFQSTPSVWRETITAIGKMIKARISIHSLRVEGDYKIGVGIAKAA